MDVDIINIGNSKGIRIPSSVLKKFSNIDSFELLEESGGLLLKPKSSKPRVGWNEKFVASPDDEHDKDFVSSAFEEDGGENLKW